MEPRLIIQTPATDFEPQSELVVQIDSSSGLQRICPVVSLGLKSIEFCCAEYAWPGTRLSLTFPVSGGRSHALAAVVTASTPCGDERGYRVAAEFVRHFGNSWTWLSNLPEEHCERSDRCISCAGCDVPVR